MQPTVHVDPDKARQIDGACDLDPNFLTLMEFLLERTFQKKSADNKKACKITQ